MTQEDKQTLESLTGFLCRHLVAICVVYHHHDSDGNATKGPFLYVGSGFVLSSRGLWHLITAGHVIHEIEELHNTEGIGVHAMFLVDFLGLQATHHNSIPFEFHATTRFAHDDVEAGLDFGFFLIHNNQRTLLESNGVVPIDETHWIRQHEIPSFEGFLMLGLPNELVETKAELNSTGFVTIGSVQPVMMQLCPVDAPDDALTTYPRFVARISNIGCLESIKGMSGGPIIGYRDVNGRLGYWIIALQSRWDRRSQTVFGCPVAIFARMIEKAVSEVT